jgi:hypothetical protein
MLLRVKRWLADHLHPTAVHKREVDFLPRKPGSAEAVNEKNGESKFEANDSVEGGNDVAAILSAIK